MGEHKERLQEAKRLHEEKNKQLKIQQDKLIQNCKTEIAKCDADIEQVEKRIKQVQQDCNVQEERLVVLHEKNKNFDKYRQDELEKVKVQIGFAKEEEDFKRIEMKLNSSFFLGGEGK